VRVAGAFSAITRIGYRPDKSFWLVVGRDAAEGALQPMRTWSWDRDKVCYM